MHVGYPYQQFSIFYVYTRAGTGQDFFDPTGKFQNLRRFQLTGFSPARWTGYFAEGIVYCSMNLIQCFKRGDGHGEGVKIYDSGKGVRKKRYKIFVFFTKIT